ncbi:MAG: serine/threonine protein kinase [Gemmatimonadaceae bacterium]|nr:serine/threonine protein kinase [Gemmatimonadaceae bacterium]
MAAPLQTDADALTGRVLERKYRIGRRLGEGGMGAVYLAEHVGIGRDVALKIVHPELLADPLAVERFTREARAAGGIQHRHVVNVTDFGVDRVDTQDIAYLVMERLSGQTLEEVLHERGALALREVVDIVAQVAEGLAAAHHAGVVHRDLKPANIWLTPDARGGFHVTLLDFGIAKLRDAQFAQRPADARLTALPERAAVAPRARPETDGPATQVGESVGTPAYMSPEQCVGDDVDWRSDLYSLGVVVYQMLVGVLPFQGDTMALLRQHFVAEVPALPADRAIPPGVDAVLRRALAKTPAERFQSAPAFAAALRAHASGFGDSMRRALGVFADRMPELSVLGLCFAMPGLLATAGYLLFAWAPRLLQPVLWLMIVPSGMLAATPMAMASIAAVFGDLRSRPFARLTWRGAARAVSGSERDGAALYLDWLRVAFTRYLATSKAAKGNGLRNMLAYVDGFRHGGATSTPERLERMAAVLPTRAFATMAIAQLIALAVLPTIMVFAAIGVLRVLAVAPASALPVLGAVAGMAFSGALFLQVFIGIVDVMLYDLAYDMTRE